MKDGMITLWDLCMRVGIWCIVFMMPTGKAMLGLTVLASINAVTGVWKAKHKDEDFKWLTLLNSFFKLVAYQMAITVTYITEQIFFNGLPLTQVVAGIMAAKELQSSLDNLHTVTGLDLWTNIKELFKRKVP